MPRPKKERRICCDPAAKYYKPRGILMCNLFEISIYRDEIETLRLADFEMMSHEQGAEKMRISRATFGRILEKARFKIADAVINGKAIKIETTIK